MFEAFMFLQVLAWPAVAWTALILAAKAYDDYAKRQRTKIDSIVKAIDAVYADHGDVMAKVNELAVRVGQLEISQGVKRGRA